MKKRAPTPATRLIPAWSCEAAPVDSGGVSTSLVEAVGVLLVLSVSGTDMLLVGITTELLPLG